MSEETNPNGKLAEMEALKALSSPGKLQTVIVMAVVGAAFTVAVLVMLGHFTRPESTIDASMAAVASPFVDPDPAAEESAPLDEETCQVMSTAIKDINARMSEGVNEKQASYFRSRRNKLYQMMRDRCGV